MKRCLTGLCLLFASLSHCHPTSTTAQSARPSAEVASAIFQVETGSVKVSPLEIADDPNERQVGLMFRREMAADAGMLFIFESEEEHSFWMQNTYIPLDMIFLDAQKKIVGIVPNAEPLTTTARTVGKPSKYVLETNAGFAQSHLLVTGVQAEFVLPTASRR